MSRAKGENELQDDWVHNDEHFSSVEEELVAFDVLFAVFQSYVHREALDRFSDQFSHVLENDLSIESFWKGYSAMSSASSYELLAGVPDPAVLFVLLRDMLATQFGWPDGFLDALETGTILERCRQAILLNFFPPFLLAPASNVNYIVAKTLVEHPNAIRKRPLLAIRFLEDLREHPLDKSELQYVQEMIEERKNA